MNLAAIPAGRTVLVDTNLLLYQSRGASGDISAFLERCETGAVAGFVTSIILGEFCHRLMMLEASQAGLAGSNPARVLSRRPDLVRSLPRYPEKVRNLLEGGLYFEPVRKEDFQLGLELQARHGLLTNDSLNLAVALRLALEGIATADQGFDRISGIPVYKPPAAPTPSER
jgi:predicted nucleic acid-binding protein